MTPSILQQDVASALDDLGISHQAIDCDPTLADTADFCAHYGFTPEQSANTLLVGSTKGDPVFACCVLLANYRLDVNKTVRKKLGVRRLSFANPEVTKQLTGMELGGVTPFALPANLPLWIDTQVMLCDQIILGGGNRSSKILMPPDGLLKIPNIEVVEGLANRIDKN